MVNSEDKLVLPNDLVLLWENAHGLVDNKQIESQVENIWQKLCTALSRSVLYKNTPGITSQDDGMDAAMDYVAHLLSEEACPQYIKTYGILERNFRKFLAKTRNPVQFELNQILHTALLTLEENGMICRSEAQKEKNIGADTLFALAGTKKDCMGSEDSYEQNKSSIPHYTTIARNNNWAETRIITPEHANDLVLKLLAAFGGWVPKQKILSAMWNHIPPQFIIQRNCQEDDDSNQIANIPSEEDEYIYEHEREQSYSFGFEMSEHIWQRITKVSNRVFCLLFLPKNLYNRKVTLAELGPTSTIEDQNNKIIRILEEELINFKDYFSQTYMEKSVQNLVIRKIFNFLQHRCTEIGYSPNLYTVNGERN